MVERSGREGGSKGHKMVALCPAASNTGHRHLTSADEAAHPNHHHRCEQKFSTLLLSFLSSLQALSEAHLWASNCSAQHPCLPPVGAVRHRLLPESHIRPLRLC